MSGKFKYLLTALLFAFLPLTFSGCFFCYLYEEYCFDLTYELKTGVEFPLYDIIANNLYVAPAGSVAFSGQLNNASTSYPRRLSILCRHFNKSGDLIEKMVFPLRVNRTSGKIGRQTFNVSDTPISPDDKIHFSVKSLGALPPSSLTLSFEYKKI